MADVCPPKRPQNAYWLWLADNRENIATAIGTKNGPDVSKAAGPRFAAISAAVKKEYDDKAAKLKADYDKALAGFMLKHKDVAEKLAQEKKQAKADKKSRKAGKAAKKDLKKAKAARPGRFVACPCL